MFTGIVETIGTISSLVPHDPSSNGGTTLTITNCASILTDAHLGDSISINGTCLTITAFTPHDFKVGVAPETLRRTNLGSLTKEQDVNLERALLPTTRLGGHFVQGHVDTVATILSVVPDGEALTFRLRPRERSVLRYVVEKGYVTLDGASLTVTRVEEGEGEGEGWWEVMLIAYTRGKVVMGGKVVGGEVNVEVDMVGKYVERSVRGYFEGMEGGGGGLLERLVGRVVEERMGRGRGGMVEG